MTRTATDYRTSAIADGYIYECSCGELYRVLDAAKHCRKCRTYTERGMCTRVDDISTGAVVYDFESVLVRREAEEKAARAEYTRLATAPFTLADVCPELASLNMNPPKGNQMSDLYDLYRVTCEEYYDPDLAYEASRISF